MRRTCSDAGVGERRYLTTRVRRVETHRRGGRSSFVGSGHRPAAIDKGDTMDMRSTFAALTLALAAAGFAPIGQAASVDVEIGVAPPAPPERVEIVPAPREGYIYERGHYGWDGNRYVWVEGQFIQ